MSEKNKDISYYTGKEFKKSPKAVEQKPIKKGYLGEDAYLKPKSLGDQLVDKVRYRPPRYMIDQYKRGEISFEDLQNPQKILNSIKSVISGTVDFIVPQTPGNIAAELAGLKAISTAYKGLSRLGANVPRHFQGGWHNKVGDMRKAITKHPSDVWKSVRHDVPYMPTIPEARRVAKRVRVDSPAVLTTGEQVTGSSFKRVVDTHKSTPLTKDILVGKDPQSPGNFMSRYYSFRRGLRGLDTTPKGFKNKKFLEENPQYKEMAEKYDEFRDDLLEYEMKDPSSGKVLPHVSYKRVPSEIRQSLKGAPIGRSSHRFGQMGNYGGSRYPVKQFDEFGNPYTEWVHRYEDKFDFNTKDSNIWGKLLKGGDQVSDAHRKAMHKELIKEGVSPKDVESMLNSKLLSTRGASGNRSYYTTLGEDLLTNVVEQFMTPVVWKGEFSTYKLPRHAGRFLKMLRYNDAPKLVRRLRPKSGTDVSELVALKKEFGKDPTKFWKDDPSGSISFYQRGAPSTKQKAVGRRFDLLQKRLDLSPPHSGVQRFGGTPKPKLVSPRSAESAPLEALEYLKQHRKSQ